jgi:hypothetical protein
MRGLDRTAGDPRLFEWSQFQERLGLTGMPATGRCLGIRMPRWAFPGAHPDGRGTSRYTDAVLPPEGSLRRRVFLDVKPDQAQVRQSADEIAAVWAAAVNAQLERVKRNAKIESGGLDYLMGEARAQGMTP